jgi:uncharacterized protein
MEIPLMASPDVQARPWIDTNEFTRTGQRLSGRCPLALLARMSDMLTDDNGYLDWSLDGERSRRADGGFDAHLALAFSGAVRMRCVRCLEPVEITIEDRRHFKLVVTESVAEREDAQTDDFDLLVTSPHFEVLDLLEDEAIMALPLAPSHGTCARPGESAERPGGAGVGIDPDETAQGGRPNPFAVLAALKKPRSSGDGEN